MCTFLHAMFDMFPCNGPSQPTPSDQGGIDVDDVHVDAPINTQAATREFTRSCAISDVNKGIITLLSILSNMPYTKRTATLGSKCVQTLVNLAAMVKGGITSDSDCSTIGDMHQNLECITNDIDMYLPRLVHVAIKNRSQKTRFPLNAVHILLGTKAWFSDSLVNWCVDATAWCGHIVKREKYIATIKETHKDLEIAIEAFHSGIIDCYELEANMTRFKTSNASYAANPENTEDDYVEDHVPRLRPTKRRRMAIVNTDQPSSSSMPGPSTMLSPPHMASMSSVSATTSSGSMFECPITREPIVKPAYINCHTCRNMYEEEALRSWLATSKRCPTCNVDIHRPNVTIPHNTIIPVNQGNGASDDASMSQ
jgi:hypothetical protein